MQNETITYVRINPPTVRDKMVGGMAICVQPDRTFRHQLYDVINPQSHVVTGKIELEVESSRISLTFSPNAVPDTQAEELVMGVSDFDTAHRLLSAMGMHARSFQEVKREVWEMGKVTIALESWPWLDPFIIIGAPDKTSIEKIAIQLGLDNDQIYENDVLNMYRDKYGIDESMFYNTPKLMFMVRPSWVQAFDDKVMEEVHQSQEADTETAEAGTADAEDKPAETESTDVKVELPDAPSAPEENASEPSDPAVPAQPETAKEEPA